MQREELVVGIRVNDGLACGEQLRANQQGEDSAKQEGRPHKRQVHHADALVIQRIQPVFEP